MRATIDIDHLYVRKVIERFAYYAWVTQVSTLVVQLFVVRVDSRGQL